MAPVLGLRSCRLPSRLSDEVRKQPGGRRDVIIALGAFMLLPAVMAAIAIRVRGRNIRLSGGDTIHGFSSFSVYR